MSTLTTQRQIVLTFAATVAARLAFHVYTGFTADDAFITFRYADNIADGLGFVYNEGQQVLGTTTPLFTFLIAMFRLVSFPPVPAALLISALSSGFTAILLLRLAQLLRFRSVAALPVILYILWPRLLPAETSGMEAALFVCLTTAAIYYHHKGVTYYATAMATLAVLTRPEGLWLVALILVDITIRDRRALLSHMAIPVTLLIPWILFALWYFGSAVPHSIDAKLVLYDQLDVDSPLQRFIYVMGWHNPGGWVILVAALFGGYWLRRKQNFGGIAIAWLIGLILFYTVSDTHLFFWYLAPLYPMYLVLATAAVPYVLDRFHVSPGRFRAAGVMVSIVALLVTGMAAAKPATYYREYQHYLNKAHKAIGLYLWHHAEETDLLAAEDIGYMGYYSRLTVLDRDGLISPAAVPYIRSGDMLQLILDYDPVWVVTAEHNPLNAFTDSTRFRTEYGLEERFAPENKPVYELWHQNRL